MASSVEMERLLSDPNPRTLGPRELSVAEFFLSGFKRTGSL
jgi:hypothetical protein